jgi:hypothetical protein
MGLEIAKQLCMLGCSVALCDVRTTELEDSRDMLQGKSYIYESFVRTFA